MALNANLKIHAHHKAGEDPGKLEVWEVRWESRIDGLFELFVRCGWQKGSVWYHDFLGAAATLELPDEPFLPVVHGIVRDVGIGSGPQAAQGEYLIRDLQFHIVPGEWLLTMRKGCRIFQNKTVPAIVEEVIADYPRLSLAKRLRRTYEEREYCVQYDETDHDFVRRLLAEEGITTFFDHAGEGVWTLADDTTLLEPGEDRPVVLWKPANLKPSAPAVIHPFRRSAMRTGRAVRRDYNFENPHLLLEGQWDQSPRLLAPNEELLEDYSYQPGRFTSLARGEVQALQAVEGARSARDVIFVVTNFAAFAGCIFLNDDIDGAQVFLVLACSADFRSSPDTQDKKGEESRRVEMKLGFRSDPCRPEPRKKPLVFGTQTARVVGDTPPGTVDVDQYGRVKVEFRWDRRDLGKGNPTRWVRVVQAWAGPGYGLVTLPRVGDEVVVAYEEGDPDQPLVIGRVHNAVSRTPLRLPTIDRTKSIWMSQSFGPNGPVEGYNAIAMDDEAGAEVLGFKAQRDLVSLTGRNASVYVGADESIAIGGNQVMVVAGNQTVRVGGRAAGPASGGGVPSAGEPGSQEVHVSGAYSLQAKGMVLDSSDYLTAHSAGNMVLNSDADRMDNSKNHYLFAEGTLYGDAAAVTLSGKTILLQAGGSSITLHDGGITITSSGPVDINGSPVLLNC